MTNQTGERLARQAEELRRLRKIIRAMRGVYTLAYEELLQGQENTLGCVEMAEGDDDQ